MFTGAEADDETKGAVRVGLLRGTAVGCMRWGASTAPPWVLLDPPPSTQTHSVLLMGSVQPISSSSMHATCNQEAGGFPIQRIFSGAGRSRR